MLKSRSSVAYVDVALICKLNEQGSFTARQHRIRYSYNKKKGDVMVYTFGQRTDETFRELSALLKPLNIGMLTINDRGSYAREIPNQTSGSQNNLSVEPHEKFIETFIEKYIFY